MCLLLGVRLPSCQAHPFWIQALWLLQLQRQLQRQLHLHLAAAVQTRVRISSIPAISISFRMRAHSSLMPAPLIFPCHHSIGMLDANAATGERFVAAGVDSARGHPTRPHTRSRAQSPWFSPWFTHTRATCQHVACVLL